MSKIRKVITYNGKAKEVGCISCARAKGKINLGSIVKSKYFDAHQEYETAIPGFIVIASKRHFKSIDNFTKDERRDFIDFLCKIRNAMRKVIGIETVYLFQAEDTVNHFHIWIFPRYDWMTEKFGAKVESIRPIIEYAQSNFKTKSDIDKVDETTKKLKQFLSNK